MPAPALVELRDVRKSFRAVRALDGVDVRVQAGEVLALLGANGAGKTTAIALMLGLRRPDAGAAFLFGRDPRRPDARARCGATPQEIGLPETLRVSEILEFVRKHFPHPLPTEELLTRFGLDAFARRQAGGLSGGERRRVAVALAFAGDPDVAFLDEPSASLDVEARNALWDSIRSFAERGRAIVLTTHDLVEAQALATRIVVLERGRVVANGPADAITGSSPILVRLRRQRLPPLRNAISIEPERDAIAIRTTDEAELLRELVALRAELHGIEIVRTGLEQLLQGRQP